MLSEVELVVGAWSSVKKSLIEQYDFKKSKDQCYLGFRIPHLTESLFTSMTTKGPFQLMNKAVWRRINKDQVRGAKQTIKIEDKLAAI
jgi:hypothetical protein